MPVAAWHPSLPQSPQKNFTEIGGALIVRTPMDSGPAKLRRRGKMPGRLNLTFIMTTSQVQTLESWARDTIGAVSRFTFPHPRTGAQVEVRFIPQSEGDLYTITYLAPEYWTVTTTFEILP